MRGDDVSTLARAVEFEGLPQDAVLWCLLQRFCYLSALERGIEIAPFVRSYADSINPAWFMGGERYEEHVSHLRDIGKEDAASFERRKAQARSIKAERPWEMISTKTRDLVLRTLAGATSTPCPGAVHYWSSKAGKSLREIEARALNQAKAPSLTLMDIGAGFGPGVNVFFSSAGSGHLTGLSSALVEQSP
jgi:hypothetical protein